MRAATSFWVLVGRPMGGRPIPLTEKVLAAYENPAARYQLVDRGDDEFALHRAGSADPARFATRKTAHDAISLLGLDPAAQVVEAALPPSESVDLLIEAR